MELSYKLFYFQGWEYFLLFLIVLVLIFSMIHSFLNYRKNKKSE
jgi:hypothetical protein